METCCSDFDVLTLLILLLAASKISVPFKKKGIAIGTCTFNWREQSFPLNLSCDGA